MAEASIMATKEMTLFITGIDNKTHVMTVNGNVSIDNLINTVSLMLFTSSDELKLSFNDKILKCGHKLSDYGINNNSTLLSKISINGGSGIKTFLPIKFPNINSKDGFVTKQLGKCSSCPSHRLVNKGLFFWGKCTTNALCKAYKDLVVIPKEMFEETSGYCFVNKEITELKCPVCDGIISENNCFGCGIVECKANIQCKTENDEMFKYHIKAGKHEATYVLKMDDKNFVVYKYIVIVVSELSDGIENK